MNYIRFINKSYRILQRNKIISSGSKENLFINEICNRIFEALDSISINFKFCLEIGSRNNSLENLITIKNNKINYLHSDISYIHLNHLISKFSKICFDQDIWSIKENSIDLIISNFYLHWSNNLELVMRNILSSLKNNGFFICSLPGPKTMFELKKV